MSTLKVAAAVAANGAPNNAAGAVVIAETIDGGPDGLVAATLARASMLDNLTHAEQVVKRDLCAVFGGTRAVTSGKSQLAASLEPPTLREFEPDHLVADPE
jgi:hypothetical protein